MQRLAAGHIGNERAHGQLVDRNRWVAGVGRRHAVAGRVGNPIRGLHPKVVVDRVDRLDIAKHLHPIGRIPARHDEPRRISVQKR